MFFLIGDDQAHKQLPCTLFLRLLQLTIASIDRYEPWDQAALVKVAKYHLGSVPNQPHDDGESFFFFFNLSLLLISTKSNEGY